MNDDVYIKRRKVLAVSIVAIFIVVVIASIFGAYFNQKDKRVLISGLDSCLTNSRGSDRDLIVKEVYRRVNEQNIFRGIKSESSYDASVRKDSCKLTESVEYEQRFTSSNFIVDIPSLQYSFRVRYNYIPTNIPENKTIYVDLGSVSLYCLNEDEVIYPDFGCGETGMIHDEPDPITKINGDVSDGCYLNYTTSGTSKSGYAVILEYKPKESVYLDGKYGEFKKKCYADAMQRLKDEGIDLGNYYFYEKE